MVVAAMQTLAEALVSNTAIAALLALVAVAAGYYRRRPALVSILWMLVLLKLVTPPLVRIPVALFNQRATIERPIVSIPHAPRVAEPPIAEPTRNFDLQSGQAPLSTATERGDDARESGIRSSDVPPSSTQFDATESSAAPAPLPAEPASSWNDRTAAGASPGKLPANASFPWSELLLGIWLTGSLAVFSTMLIRIARFCRQVRRPWPSNPALQRQADRLAKRFGLARAPEIKVVNASLPPMLWAVQRSPAIFLPRVLVERFNAEQTETLLAHELAHFRRRDHWVRWLEVLIVGIYWWHPLAWIARRQLQRAEEECCDAWVLWSLPGAAAVYARTILETVDFLTADYHPPPALVSGLGPVHVLQRRFEMILHTQPPHRVGSLGKAALVLLALVVLPLSARGQLIGEPGKPEAAPAPESPKIPTGTAEVATGPTAPIATSAPIAEGATEPVAVATSTEAAPTAPIGAGGPAAPGSAAPVAGGPAAPIGVGGPPAPIAPGERNGETRPEDPRFRPPMGAYPGTPAVGHEGSASTEDRLTRLEKMMQTILAEMRGQQPRNQLPSSKFKTGSFDATGSGSAALSLSELKKQRIDLEDELDSIKDRMDKIDAEIAKLQSARPTKPSSNDPLR